MTDEEIGQVSADDLTQGWKVKFPPGQDIEIIELDR
jgi:hypothetical protein